MCSCVMVIGKGGVGHSHHECGVGNVDAAPICSAGGLQHQTREADICNARDDASISVSI